MREIGEGLHLPDGIKAVVFDMDGVLIDSVTSDYELCVQAANAVLGDSNWLTRAAILEHFALHPPAFWARLAEDAGKSLSDEQLKSVVSRYDALRVTASFPVIDGAVRLIEACRAAGLKLACASSNDLDVVGEILATTGLAAAFEAVSGITETLGGKPAPDLYREAARQLDVTPEACAFIEDSVTGLQAGKAAGYGYAIGVATGATRLETLAATGLADVLFDRFANPQLSFLDGEPTRKTLDTPNDFVSHMVEHIAWRMGTGIDLSWRSTDWKALGRWLGQGLTSLNLKHESAATLGMIDDGAAETLIDFSAPKGLDFDVHPTLPIDRIRDMRVEQVARGAELEALLEGLSDGLGAHLTVRVCTFEDPHHSWEGVFRSVGICLDRLRVAA